MDQIREAIEAELRELDVKRVQLERALEALRVRPQRIRNGEHRRVTPAKPVADDPLWFRNHPAVLEAAGQIQAYLHEHGEWRGTGTGLAEQLGLKATTVQRAMQLLRAEGKVENRGGQRAGLYVLSANGRATVVEPGVGVREGRRIPGIDQPA